MSGILRHEQRGHTARAELDHSCKRLVTWCSHSATWIESRATSRHRPTQCLGKAPTQLRRVSGTAPLAERCLDAFTVRARHAGPVKPLMQPNGHVVRALSHLDRARGNEQASPDSMPRESTDSLAACQWHRPQHRLLSAVLMHLHHRTSAPPPLSRSCKYLVT